MDVYASRNANSLSVISKEFASFTATLKEIAGLMKVEKPPLESLKVMKLKVLIRDMKERIEEHSISSVDGNKALRELRKQVDEVRAEEDAVNE